MQPSSTGVLLGLPALVIQPSSVRPSKSKSQPSAFSRAVNSLSAAAADAASNTTLQIAAMIFIGAHHPFHVTRQDKRYNHEIHEKHEKTRMQLLHDRLSK